MHIAQAAQALHLTVVRVTGEHVVGERVHLPPFLQVHGGIGLGDFQADIAGSLGFSFLERAFGATRPVAGAVHVGLGQAQAHIARCLGHQGFQAGFAAGQVTAIGTGLGG